MITSELQYKTSAKEVDRVEQAISALGAAAHDAAGDDPGRTMQLAALRSQLADLRVDVSEYEAFKPGQARRAGGK